MNRGPHPFTALILAGGRATRLGGIVKATLDVGGETIFERQTRLLAPRVVEIVVATGSASWDPAPHRTVQDSVAGAGPIAGIAAGLAAVTTPWLLVVAGDMPDLTGELFDRVIGAASDTIDAVGIRIGDLPEPLLCALRVAAARPVVERRLAEGRLKASALLTDAGLRVAWIDDVDPAAVRNINTPADLR
jgi:molybdopterin-guanine dinucleotide biosynthesis protein A